MTIETAAEACAALAVIIAAADEVGTSEEREFLYETIASLRIFEELDRDQFRELMRETTECLYTTFPLQGNRMSSDGIGQLMDMIRAALPTDQRVEVIEAAVGLAQSDEVVSVEALLLQRLCEGLEIDTESTNRLLGPLV